MSSDVPQFSSAPTPWSEEELRGFLSLITYGFTNPMPDADDGPWKLTAKDVVGGRINYSAARKTTQEAFDGALTDKSRPKVGDVLLTKDGSIGRVAVVDRTGVCINQSVALLRPNQRITSEYLKYLLLSPYYQSVMEGDSDGSTIKHIYITRVDKMQVAVPSLAEQKAIVGLVGALDDRISLLRETNATLEAIAQALFKSWFVDFNPVRAKMGGRAPEGMDDATAALFPDGLEESALGLVPRGWRVGSIGEHTSYLNRGISPKYIEDGGIVVINQKCIRDYSLDLSKARRHDPAQRKIDGRELFEGDILVNSTGVGTLGRVAQVLALETPAIVDSHVTMMRAGATVTWNFLGLSIMRRQPEIEGMGEGSTGQTELSRGKLAALKLLVPPAAVLQEFDGVVLPLRERISANQMQAQTLATLRDTLLPRLISGQLRLPEALTRVTEEVTA